MHRVSSARTPGFCNALVSNARLFDYDTRIRRQQIALDPFPITALISSFHLDMI